MQDKNTHRAKSTRSRRISARTGKPVRVRRGEKKYVILKPRNPKSGTLIAELARQGLCVAVPKGTTKAAIAKKLKAVAKRTAKLATSTTNDPRSGSTPEDQPRARLVGTPVSRTAKLKQLPWAQQARLEAAPGMGDTLSSDEIAARLNTTRETVNQWRLAGRLIGLKGAKRGVRYPAEQIGPNYAPMEGIREVLAALGGDHWEAWRFLTEEVDELDGTTGFDALRAGRLQEVLEVLEARSYGSFS